MKLKSIALILALPMISCSSIASLVSDITSADCDAFVLSETGTNLSDECQDLAGYLDTDTDSLATVSQAMPVGNLSDTKTVFMQLTDSTGTPITDLTADDVTLEVSEDGTNFTEIETQGVENLDDVDTTQLALLMNIDYSASISDDDLTDVVDGLNIFFDVITVGYNGAVIKFSTDVDLISDFTDNETTTLAAIDDTDYDRESTSLNDAIYDGVTELAAEDEPLKLMILFTDGLDNDSDHSQDEAVAYAQENNIPVCIVGVGFADVDTLNDIATDTGCFFVYKTLFGDLSDAFTTFGNQLNGFQMVSLPSDFSIEHGTMRVTSLISENNSRQFTFDF